MIISKHDRKQYKQELLLFNIIFILLLILIIIFIVEIVNRNKKPVVNKIVDDYRKKNILQKIPTIFTSRKEYYDSWKPILDSYYQHLLFVAQSELNKESKKEKIKTLKYTLKDLVKKNNLFNKALLEFSFPNYTRLSDQIIRYLLYPSGDFNFTNEYFKYSQAELINELKKITFDISSETLTEEERIFNDSFNSLNKPSRSNVPIIDNTPFNESQLNAINNALTEPLTIIQGPPGTGKTKTSIEIIRRMVEEYKSTLSSKKILLTASSNYAVDQLVEKCIEKNIPVIRIYSRNALKKEILKGSSSTILKYSLDNAVKEYAKINDIELYNIIEKQDENILKNKSIEIEEENEFEEEVEEKLPQFYYTRRNNIEKLIISDPNLYCIATTCTKLDHQSLNSIYFDSILIDEAAQMLETEALLAINKSNKDSRIVLVGDPEQLPPSISDTDQNTFTKLLFGRSLFKRLVDAIDSVPNPLYQKQFLDTQYRMYPSIAEFSNKMFYNNNLKNGKNTYFLPINMEQFWNFNTYGYPMLFWDNKGLEIVENKTHKNESEALKINFLVNLLEYNGVSAEKIGIISPYRKQNELLNTIINKDRIDKISIATVDSYQGQERDYILLSTVRSNINFENEESKNGSIGFLKDPNRLNVALTRAKFGIFIVGNSEFLSKNDELWNKLVMFYSNKGCLRKNIKIN